MLSTYVPRMQNILKCVLAVVCVISIYDQNWYANAKLISKQRKVQGDASMIRKLNKLVEMMDGSKGSIRMSMKEYKELVFNPPRNHTTFVLFTNHEHICDSCSVIENAFDQVAKSFLSTNTRFDEGTYTWNLEVPAFFVVVSMYEGYRQLLLELDPALPSLYHFAPSRSLKHNQFDKMDPNYLLPELDYYQVEYMLHWIEQVADIRIILEKIPAKGITSTLVTTVLIGVMVLFNIYHFGYWDNLVSAVKHCNHAYFITVVVVWLLSGQMYNFIRYTPFLGVSRGGFLEFFIYPSSRSQYGIESVIIMMLYACIMYGVIQLIETREHQLNENLPLASVQSNMLAGLSYVYTGFMIIQFLAQLKTGR